MWHGTSLQGKNMKAQGKDMKTAAEILVALQNPAVPWTSHEIRSAQNILSSRVSCDGGASEAADDRQQEPDRKIQRNVEYRNEPWFVVVMCAIVGSTALNQGQNNWMDHPNLGVMMGPIMTVFGIIILLQGIILMRGIYAKRRTSDR